MLSGRDALGILPTGGGKSVCYQVPALTLGGLTLVVTPLVSLMEDQVARAREAGLRAAHMSSTQSAGERRRTGERARAGALDILFVSPERLEVESFRELLRRLDVRLLAVDEAHCISEWGHDFRPAYRHIGRLACLLHCPTLALTASATPAVRDDIATNLSLEDPEVVVRSFDRPNLSWSVVPGGPLHDRVRTLCHLVRRRGGSTIVYAPTRRSVETVRDSLARFGIPTEAYHAGLRGEERSRVQGAFMTGECRTVVATNAFGMGIDKADVRTVVHVQLPGTLESYYQEAGRAGRDGEAARCIAFYGRSDRKLHEAFIDRTHPPLRLLARLHRRLRLLADARGVAAVDHASIASLLGGSPRQWMAGEPSGPLAALERVGAVRRLDPAPSLGGTVDGRVVSSSHRVGVRARGDFASAARQRKHARAKLDAVERFARTRGCRRRMLLRYFGEEARAGCGRCDRCRPRLSDLKPAWIDT